ncbi:MAG: hypothetical protein AAGJ12_05645 [Bacteroidota bacterium]
METLFQHQRLKHICGCFIFCCFTGLAYADIKKLSYDDFVTGIDEELWIHTNGTKIRTKSNIPVLSTALMILEKYEDSPYLVNGKVLPVLTNQKMNTYLKEVQCRKTLGKNRGR